MPGLELASLETSDAEAYWRAFLAGRTDVPTTDVRVHIDRYLALPQDEQKTYFAVKENGRIIGTVRLAGNFLGTFSLLPEERRWTQDAILVALEPLIQSGPERVVASYEDAYSTEFERLGFLERFSRIRMEAPVRTTPPPAVPMAHPEVTDLEDVMRFLMGVYEGHIEQKFGMHVGSETEWREYVTGIWKGDSGSYLPLASWALRDPDGVAGVAPTTHWMGAPPLSELGGRKDRRGEGPRRGPGGPTMKAPREPTDGPPRLYRTIGNRPALPPSQSS